MPDSQLLAYLTWSSVRPSISDSHGQELEPPNLLIYLPGHGMDPRLQVSTSLGHVFGAKGLVGEAHVHDTGRMALGGGKVDQPALGQKVDAPAVSQRVLPDRTFRMSLCPTDSSSIASTLISTLKWPLLATSAPSFITDDVVGVDGPESASHGHEDMSPTFAASIMGITW